MEVRKKYVCGKPSMQETIYAFLNAYSNQPYLGQKKTNNQNFHQAKSNNNNDNESQKTEFYHTQPPADLDSEYNWITYGEMLTRISTLASNMMAREVIQPSKTIVAIIGSNSIDWITVDFLCTFENLISIPIMKNMDDSTLCYILNHAEVNVVVCDEDFLNTLLSVVSKTPTVKTVITMNPSHSQSDKPKMMIPTAAAVTPLPLVFSLTDFLETTNTPNPVTFFPRKPSQLFSIMYTSGSTGTPKGAIMTDERWNKMANYPFLVPSPLLHLSYAPLAHVMERQHILTLSTWGAKIVIFNSEMTSLFSEFQRVCPTFVTAAPRIWNQIYSEYQFLLSAELEKPEVKQYLNTFEQYFTPENYPYWFNLDTQKSQWEDPQQTIEDGIMQKFKLVLGGKHQYIVTGGASISPSVLTFLRRLFAPIPVFDGYGTTECGGITTNTHLGTNVDVRLEDCPELGYYQKDGRGEIVVKTDYIIPGYWKNEEANQAAFTEDGYFRTGDIGEYSLDRGITIIDRKKNILKLSQGEFVAPENLENLFLESDYIEQIFIYGNPLKSYLIAIIIPNQKYLLSVAASHYLVFESPQSLYNDAKIHSLILENLHLLGRKLGLKPYEIPKAIHLSSQPFTIENDQMTPSLKKKRRIIEEYYAPVLEQLSQELDHRQSRFNRLVSQTLGLSDSFQQGKDVPLSVQLETLGSDSLSTVKLMSLVKKEFNQDISLQALQSASSIHELTHFDYRASGSGLEKAFSTDFDLKFEPSSPEFYSLIKVFTPKPLQELGHILLTGATGLIGSHILDQLLSKTQATIYCLIRPKSTEESLGQMKDRVLNLLREACGTQFQNNEQDRISIFPVDLKSTDWSLPREWSTLIDFVIHSAANVNWVQSYSALRTVNVLSTIQLLKFAATDKIKPFLYLSTAGVMDPTVGNTSIHPKPEYLNGYTQTKLISEKYVRSAFDRFAYPLWIFRPGMISGNRTTGYCNPADFVSRYLIGSISFAAFIESDFVQDMTPVDWLAETIFKMISRSHRIGSICPCTHPSPPTFSTLGRWVQAYLKTTTSKDSVQLVSYPEWRAHLQATDEAHILYPLRPYFPQNWFVPSVVPNNISTLFSPVVYPDITEELIGKYLSHLLKRQK